MILGLGYKLNLRINGEEFSAFNNGLKEIIVTESVQQTLPMMQMIFSNNSSLVDNGYISDGTEIDFLLTITNGLEGSDVQEKEIKFRVFNYELFPSKEGYLYKVTCMMSLPNLFKLGFDSKSGTSSGVIRNIANENNLNSDIDNTFDYQTWIKSGKGISWIKSITDHAWSNNFSCFVSCIKRNSTLTLADLTLRKKKINPDWTFKQVGDVSGSKEMGITEMSVKSSAGTLNHVFGYGRSYKSYNVITSKDEKVVINKTIKSNKFLPLSKTYNQVQRFQSLEFDMGNFHINYLRAKAQNARFRALNSVTTKVYTEEPENVQLLDLVNLIVYKDDLDSPQQETYSGKYLVSRISTRLIASGISRSFVLIKDGINPSNSSEELI